ncbi:PREDICTED: dual specificity protein phosphatase 18-like, partial [Chrysochloris asiatica]|uniref:Dual specificity protein phosphatase 18-like n=1 Tax=Chrysochloris asiatica TaxID=185453 RepID=A0A9B0WNN3_CHRAS
LEKDNMLDMSRITSNLYISNGLAANNKIMLSNKHITTIINASVELENVCYENIQYVRVPVADTPSSNLFDYFDPIADHIHDVTTKQGCTLIHCVAGVSRSATLCIAYLMKYHSMSLLDAHIWTKSCRPVIRPNNGFWEQLIRYEYKLFSKNTVHMISLSVGMIPDVYNEKAH